MCEKTQQRLPLEGLAAKSKAKPKLSRVAKTLSCHANGRLISPIGKHKDHELYSIWKTMRTRCRNPKRKDYDHYGGRGIRVCSRWNSFVAFVRDMGPRPSPKHEIDRIDGNGDYCPDNCRWSTRREQLQHFSRSHYLTIGGEQLSISGWSRRSGIATNLIGERMRRGWLPQDAVFTPPLNKWNPHKKRNE